MAVQTRKNRQKLQEIFLFENDELLKKIYSTKSF